MRLTWGKARSMRLRSGVFRGLWLPGIMLPSNAAMVPRDLSHGRRPNAAGSAQRERY